jgi:hypothetical protein
LIRQGYTDVVDADLSNYFDKAQLLKSVARRIVDRHVQGSIPFTRSTTSSFCRSGQQLTEFARYSASCPIQKGSTNGISNVRHDTGKIRGLQSP